MKYYIIIRGPLGVGKTTIAKKLAEVLSGEYISIDKVLEEHGLDKVEGEGIPVDNFLAANEIILPHVRKILGQNSIVIIDGNFYHREQIEHLLRNLNAPSFVFTLKCLLEECIKRDRQREKIYGSDAAAAVHMMVSQFDYGQVIDSNHKTADQIVKEILSFLPPQ